MEMSTHMSMPYLDVCICLYLNSHAIITLHLIAIPLYKSLTAAVISATAEYALDILCPLWKEIIIYISMDSERKITGRIMVVKTLIQNVVK